jgi:ferredoxin
VVYADKCIECGLCVSVCPVEAIALTEVPTASPYIARDFVARAVEVRKVRALEGAVDRRLDWRLGTATYLRN